MNNYQLAISSTADLSLTLQGVALGEYLRQPDDALLASGINVSTHGLNFRIKDHNTDVQAVFHLLPQGNAGDTAYINIDVGSHSAGWHASAIVTIFQNGVSIAKNQVDSGLNAGLGDTHGHGVVAFRLT